MINYLYLPKFREKKVLKIVEVKSPLSFEEFFKNYLNYYTMDLIKPEVFTDLAEFRKFIKTIEDKRPMAHNSCIDDYNTICVHYMNKDHHCKAALYGYKIV